MVKTKVKSHTTKKSYFNIFVEKILKRRGKMLHNQDIEKILIDIMGEVYTRTKWYKLVHLAKNRWFLISLKKDVYYAPHDWEEMHDMLQKRYWPILHDHIKTYIQGKGIITWTHALNLLLQNYEIPDVISIISPNKQCQEVIVGDKIAAIKKMASNKISLFSTIKQTARKASVNGKSFTITSVTISLLEALYAQTDNDFATIEICKKVLKKYWKQMDREEVTMLLRKGKYHTSINKLYSIARGLDDWYANHIMEIIKKHSYRIST